MTPSNPLIVPGAEHQIDADYDQCVWCGSTRQDIEEWGERICPRREPRPEPE